MTRTGGDTRTDPGPPLLFVNKDASNLSRTKAEAFAVGSHMSKVYRRWSKSQKLRNLRPTASVLQSTNVYLEIRRHPRKSLLEECDESEVAGSPQAVGAFLKLIIDRMKSTIPAKVSIYSHGYSPTIYRAMEYFMRVLVPNNSPVYSIFEVSNVNCVYFLEIIASSSAQYLYHAAFALLHLVVGNVIPRTNSSRNALQHTATAIFLLRKILSERPLQNDDATFVAIVCMASFSRALGDYAGYSIHRTRISEMMKSRGGLQKTGLHGFVKALTLQFAPPDCIPLALCFNRQPKASKSGVVDMADPFFYNTRCLLPEPPPSPSLKSNLTTTLEKLPPSFQNLIIQTPLHANTVRLLLRVADARTKQSRNQGGKRQDLSSSWQVGRYSDFWECCPSISRPGPDLEKYLCLALLLYTANEFAPQRACHKGMALYSGPRTLLAGEIGLLGRQQLTTDQKGCWMWVWWVLIDSWSEVDKTTETAMLLTNQFWAAFSEVQSWSDLQGILEGFFWGGKFGDAIKRIVDAAHSDGFQES
ncbi:hypothetical protein LTS17_011752 [Exophiala oligosperma]